MPIATPPPGKSKHLVLGRLPAVLRGVRHRQRARPRTTKSVAVLNPEGVDDPRGLVQPGTSGDVAADDRLAEDRTADDVADVVPFGTSTSRSVETPSRAPRRADRGAT